MPHAKDDFLLEYCGTLMHAKDGKKREEEHEKNQLGNFIFYFKNNEHQYW